MKIDPIVQEKLRPWFPDLDMAQVRIITRGPICRLVATVLRQGALTFAPFVFYGQAVYDPASLRSVALLAHELKHIEQYRRFGHVRFLIRYYWDMGRKGFRYRKDLPLEAEAYALQADVRKQLADAFSQP